MAQGRVIEDQRPEEDPGSSETPDTAGAGTPAPEEASEAPGGDPGASDASPAPTTVSTTVNVAVPDAEDPEEKA